MTSKKTHGIYVSSQVFHCSVEQQSFFWGVGLHETAFMNIWFLTLREKQWSQKVGREMKSDALLLISEAGY